MPAKSLDKIDYKIKNFQLKKLRGKTKRIIYKFKGSNSTPPDNVFLCLLSHYTEESASRRRMGINRQFKEHVNYAITKILDKNGVMDWYSDYYEKRSGGKPLSHNRYNVPYQRLHKMYHGLDKNKNSIAMPAGSKEHVDNYMPKLVVEIEKFILKHNHISPKNCDLLVGRANGN